MCIYVIHMYTCIHIGMALNPNPKVAVVPMLGAFGVQSALVPGLEERLVLLPKWS